MSGLGEPQEFSSFDAKGQAQPPAAVLSSLASSTSSSSFQEDKKAAILDRPAVQYPTLRTALIEKYKKAGTVELPLSSERRFPVQSVSLTISDKSVYDQEEAKRRAEKKQAEEGKVEKKGEASELFWASRLRVEESWHRVTEPLAPQDIFTSAEEQKPIQRVLVEGRAGVGKTTFSQCIAHHWATQDLWADRFDYVFWVPLREWCSYAERQNQGSKPFDLAHFVHDDLLNSDEEVVACKALADLIKTGKRVLCVLDGYDEVAMHWPTKDIFYKALDKALNSLQVILTTRDYQIPPASIPFDRRLVNIGFTDAQIAAYLWHYFQALCEHDPDRKKDSTWPERMEARLQGNPRLWGLAHIPLNLALMADLWSQPSEEKERKAEQGAGEENPEATQSLTTLYKHVTTFYLKKYLKTKPGEHQGIDECSCEDIEKKSPWVLESLGRLAYEGLKKGEVTFTQELQKSTLQTMVKHYSERGEISVTSVFKEALAVGLLKNVNKGKSKILLDNPHYFTHLTFQEYLAAYYLLQCLEGKAVFERDEKESKSISSQDKAIQWITQHKYHPQYLVMFGFLAGLARQSSDKAMETLWDGLLAEPLDRIGVRHLSLIVRCLQEAGCHEGISQGPVLLNQVKAWAMHFISYRRNDWFWSLLRQNPQVLLQSGVVGEVLGVLKQPSETEEERATLNVLRFLIPGLSSSLGLAEKVLKALTPLLTDRDSNVRDAAVSSCEKVVKAMVNLPGGVEGVFKVLIPLLRNRDFDVRRVAVRCLGEAVKVCSGLAGDVFKVLTPLLRDKSFAVDSAVADSLVETVKVLPSLAEGVFKALTPLLADKDFAVHYASVGNWEKMVKAMLNLPGGAEGVLKVLTPLLKVRKWLVRRATTDSLREAAKVSPSLAEGVFKALTPLLADEDSFARRTVAGCLGEAVKVMANLPGRVRVKDVLKALAPLLRDRDSDVRRAVVGSLGEAAKVLPSLAEDVFKVLTPLLADENSDVRRVAADSLGEATKVSPALVLEMKAGLADFLESQELGKAQQGEKDLIPEKPASKQQRWGLFDRLLKANPYFFDSLIDRSFLEPLSDATCGYMIRANLIQLGQCSLSDLLSLAFNQVKPKPSLFPLLVSRLLEEQAGLVIDGLNITLITDRAYTIKVASEQLIQRLVPMIQERLKKEGYPATSIFFNPPGESIMSGQNQLVAQSDAKQIGLEVGFTLQQSLLALPAQLAEGKQLTEAKQPLSLALVRRTGDTEALVDRMRSGELTREKDAKGFTPIHYAVVTGRQDVLTADYVRKNAKWEAVSAEGIAPVQSRMS